MADDGHAVQERIATAEKRLAALRDHGVDPAALLGQLAFARRHLGEGRITDAEAVVDEVLAAARRLAVGGSAPRMRAAPPPPPPPMPAPAATEAGSHLEERLRAVAEQVQALNQQVAALVQRPQAGGDSRITEAVRTAMAGLAGRLPTREDLEGIAENLRADLDWRLERVAAERGWCSLSDVQATVEKIAPEAAPQGVAAGAGLARLEAALSEFVNQTQRQQERLLSALKERIEATRSLTRRLPSRDASKRFQALANAAPDAADLLDPLPPASAAPPATPPGAENGDRPGSGPHPVSEPGSGQRPAAGAALSGNRPALRPATDLLLEPVNEEPATGVQAVAEPSTDRAARFGTFRPVGPPPEAESAIADPGMGADTETLPTQVAGLPAAEVAETAEAAAPPPAPAHGEALHDLVVHEVERQLQHSPTASTIGSSAPAPAPAPADVRALVAEELARLLPASDALAAAVDARLAGHRDAGSRELLLRQLPDALRLPEVRQALFAVLALEAVDHPSALGELTGLRSFLRRELKLAAEELAARGTPAPAPA